IFGENDIYINGSCKENSSKFVSKLFQSKAKSSKKVDVTVIPQANHSYIEKESILIKALSLWLSKTYNL
ncbi:hypothetical protein HY041_04100, partial [Candidatus Roizmanbacteria bacterium]|nr:hypothetical protein [Candidatus Roizmanbacteria bacterium]